jgi:hypothetical protein
MMYGGAGGSWPPFRPGPVTRLRLALRSPRTWAVAAMTALILVIAALVALSLAYPLAGPACHPVHLAGGARSALACR